jgi:hypothetical protein
MRREKMLTLTLIPEFSPVLKPADGADVWLDKSNVDSGNANLVKFNLSCADRDIAYA